MTFALAVFHTCSISKTAFVRISSEVARQLAAESRHQMPVPIERRRDRGVTELGLDLLRMRSLLDE
jgi:hypothetical protein